MSYDVVVVGGGVGGLAVAALLSARGMKVCLLERQSQVGGCIGKLEFHGLRVDPGMGIHTSWGKGELFETLFAQLSVTPPKTTLVKSDYIVRLPDQTDIGINSSELFYEQLRSSFPERGNAAVGFYKTVERVLTESSNTGGLSKRLHSFFRKSPSERSDALSRTAIEYADGTSNRFKAFIDAQLQAFAQTPIEHCSFISACVALSLLRHDRYTIEGGPEAVAESLADALKKSGGVLRLNAPVLRLAYDQHGETIGVDLLSGETVLANRAIISNMTVWDTYGKLVGLNKTPSHVKKEIAKLRSKGVYMLYASLNEAAMSRLPSETFLVTGDWPRATDESGTTSAEFTVAASQFVQSGNRGITFKTSTEVERWFSFQTGEEDYESWDQEELERFWSHIHHRIPEFGGDLEVIETASPRTYYDETRRKLGFVQGYQKTLESQGLQSFETPISKLYLVGDTASSFPSIDSVVESALALALELTK